MISLPRLHVSAGQAELREVALLADTEVGVVSRVDDELAAHTNRETTHELGVEFQAGVPEESVDHAARGAVGVVEFALSHEHVLLGTASHDADCAGQILELTSRERGLQTLNEPSHVGEVLAAHGHTGQVGERRQRGEQQRGEHSPDSGDGVTRAPPLVHVLADLAEVGHDSVVDSAAVLFRDRFDLLNHVLRA